MKKTAKLLSLAVALFAGLSGTAQAEGFKLGVDVVSSYVWRGTVITESPSLQPSASYTFDGIGVVVGAWGTNNFGDTSTAKVKRYEETDLYVTVPVGPVNISLIDYYIPSQSLNGKIRAFDLNSDGPNTLDLTAAYSINDFSFLGSVYVGGNTFKNAKYFEAGYQFHNKNKYTAKATLGLGDEGVYAASKGTNNFNLVNLGCTVSKENFSVSYTYNPAEEHSDLVFAASF
ncbi:MAG: hypothetical protein WCI64_02725 [Chlorobium sp.]